MEIEREGERDEREKERSESYLLFDSGSCRSIMWALCCKLVRKRIRRHWRYDRNEGTT